MHYSNLVIIKKFDELSGNLENEVEKAMGPNEENGGFWDWYQIGGRWSGTLDGFDPATDPANVESCTVCGGTGFRNDAMGVSARAEAPTYTCNGCGTYDSETMTWGHKKEGPGKRVKWPTSWAQRKGDIIPIENLTQEMLDNFYRIVERGQEFGGKEYLPWRDVGSMFQSRERPPLEWLQKQYADHLCVVVDNHQ